MAPRAVTEFRVVKACHVPREGASNGVRLARPGDVVPARVLSDDQVNRLARLQCIEPK